MSSAVAVPAAVDAAEPAVVPPPMIFIGMDVHKESVTLAVLPASAKTPTHVDRVPNDLPKLKR